MHFQPNDMRTPSPAAAVRSRYLLTCTVVLFAIAAMIIHGPISQVADYHRFADQRTWFAIPHVADVLSNLGFAIVGAYGLQLTWRKRDHFGMQNAVVGYRLFFASLILTAVGSSWYHLAPDNARLVCDRLPIALACGGLLAAVWYETMHSGRWLTTSLATFAISSVAWWRHTDLNGAGDLRPYLLLQMLPLVLVPLLQYQSRRPVGERIAFGTAIALYITAKIFEMADHAVFNALGIISGHTIKHIFASIASATIAWSLNRRDF